jgi:hypothetical protein
MDGSARWRLRSAPLQMVKLTFMLTFEEFSKAMRLHHKPAAGPRLPMWDRFLFFWILLGTFVLVFVAAVVERIILGAGETAGESAVMKWFGNFLGWWIIYLLIFGLIWFGVSRQLRPGERRSFRRVFLILLALLLAGSIVSRTISGPAATPPAAATRPAPDPQGGEAIFNVCFPWIVVFALVWFVIFRYLRGAARRAWEAQPHLALPQTVETTEHGLRLTDPNSVRDCRWAAFTKWRENEEMFLLYNSDLTFDIVPKRAAQTPQQIELFRHLLQQHVRAVDAISFGIPVASVAPVPPPPLPSLGSSE